MAYRTDILFHSFKTVSNQCLELKQPEGVHIPSERTVYQVTDQIGLSHRTKRKSNGLTKTDQEAMKSDDLLKRDFHSDAPE